MRRVLVPRYPGVLSALGMLTTDITRDYVHFLAQRLEQLDMESLGQHMTDLARQGVADMRHDAGTDVTLRAVFTLDLRYIGQSHEISTPLVEWEGSQVEHPDTPDNALIEQVAQRFHQLHQQHSGHAMPERPVEAVTLRLKMIGVVGQHGTWERADNEKQASDEAPAPRATVQAVLDSESTTSHSTALYEREALRSGQHIAGPAIIVQLDTTTVIPPGWHATIDGWEHIILSAQD
jgi:N-methylhydantoinase A